MTIINESKCIVSHNGEKCWYLNDKLHREDGPAIEYEDRKVWYLYGKCHRIDGPAVEYTDGKKYWSLNGKRIDTQEEFDRLLRLKAFW